MGYKCKFEFIKNTNYEITISVDLGRLTDYQPDDSDPFTDLAMLRLLNPDFIRVEKQAPNLTPEFVYIQSSIFMPVRKSLSRKTFGLPPLRKARPARFCTVPRLARKRAKLF